MATATSTVSARASRITQSAEKSLLSARMVPTASSAVSSSCSICQLQYLKVRNHPRQLNSLMNSPRRLPLPSLGQLDLITAMK